MLITGNIIIVKHCESDICVQDMLLIHHSFKMFNCLHPYEDFSILHLSNSGTLTRIRLIAANISILLLGRTMSRLPMNCG